VGDGGDVGSEGWEREGSDGRERRESQRGGDATSGRKARKRERIMNEPLANRIPK